MGGCLTAWVWYRSQDSRCKVSADQGWKEFTFRRYPAWDYQVTWLDLGSLCGWVWACLTGPPLTINCRRTQAQILLGGGGGLQSAEQYSEQQSQRDRAGEAEAADRERYGAAARCCGVRLRLSLPISICWEKSRCGKLSNSLLLRCGLQGCFTLWTVRFLPCHCLIFSTCKGV